MTLPDDIHVAVLVGTDHHPFDRVVSWSAALAAESGGTWLVQHGSTPWPDDVPDNLHGVSMLGVHDLGSVLESADVVVTHGGPGLIMEARAARHVPVVVPRDPALGEHVDRHQQDFTARLEADGAIVRVETPEQFRTAVESTWSRGRPDHAPTTATHDVVARFAELVEETRARPRLTPLQRLLRPGGSRPPAEAPTRRPAQQHVPAPPRS